MAGKIWCKSHFKIYFILSSKICYLVYCISEIGCKWGNNYYLGWQWRRMCFERNEWHLYHSMSSL